MSPRGSGRFLSSRSQKKSQMSAGMIPRERGIRSEWFPSMMRTVYHLFLSFIKDNKKLFVKPLYVFYKRHKGQFCEILSFR